MTPRLQELGQERQATITICAGHFSRGEWVQVAELSAKLAAIDAEIRIRSEQAQKDAANNADVKVPEKVVEPPKAATPKKPRLKAVEREDAGPEAK